MKALIDADILVYRGGFSAEHTHYRIYLEGEEDYGYIATFPSKKECNEYLKEYYPDGGIIIEPYVEIESLNNALSNTRNIIEAIFDATETNSYQLYLTGDGNYRESLVDYYKMNRKDSRKPHWYTEIREYLINNWGAEVVDGCEADDAMGIAQYVYWNELAPDTELNKAGAHTIICTLDKDLNMIPGWHYNWVNQEKYWVTEDEATLFYYTQLLTGDSTDNIAGVPKCGPAKARKILEGATTEYDMYSRCLKAYEEAYPSLGYVKLKENADLLWILREEQQLWLPPGI